MRFLLDHDVPSEIGRVLLQAGHHVALVKDAPGPSASDQDVFAYAAMNDLILVSCNRDDFLRLSAGRAHPGLVILLRRRSRIAECAAVLRLLRVAGIEGIRKNTNFA